ncbi:MAG: protein kinase [Gemmatimonadetes bacterium]|nr:protein kinase [Gemmatimonadota bacterium]
MTDVLERLTAALADRYRIERQLGEGGMATVYLAEDVKHERKVALKVLRPELAAVIGAERFLSEIKTTANLQHPHILPLHDSGEADGLLFYVMPYIEGETLRDRLEREKQLPVADAVRIAAEVADALDYAHRQNVIHRDVKPENVLLHDGRALVADFGIALAASRSSDGTRLTETGMSLGTPHYMSPEQAMGERDLDARSDVYALGCVLYEMLAGEPPFDGPTAQSIVAKVVTAQPERLTTHRKTVPPHVEAAVDTALQKLPADRFASARDFSQALARPDLMVTSSRRSAAITRASWLKDWRSIAALAVAVLGLAFGLLGRSRADTPPAPVVRFDLALPDDRQIVSQYSPIAIAPDGARLAYVGVGAEPGAPRRLYVRAFDQLSPLPIPDTDGAGTIFFSPDGAWLGFWLDDEIRKAPLAGGPAVTIVPEARQFFGSATWTEDGYVVYTSELTALAAVPDAGGEARTIYTDSGYVVYVPTAFPGSLVGFGRAPVSPSGTRRFDEAEIVVVDRATGVTTTLLSGLSIESLAYSPSGHLVYRTGDDVLFAAPFDIDRVEITGPSVPLYEGVRRFALSRSGTLVLVSSDRGATGELRLVDRAGRDTLLADQRRDYLFPRFSPDGRKVAVEIHDEAGGHIWIYDRDARTLARLTTEGHNSRPAWSPDGRQVAYSSARDSLTGIYRMNADGGGVERAIGPRLTAPYTEFSWSPDGARVAFERRGTNRSRDIWTVSVERDSVLRALVETPASEFDPAYSPDGRWIAYVSDESGRDEVYVRASSGRGGRFLVSTDGGRGAQWSGSGELYYIGDDEWLWAATLEFDPEFRVIGRERLFDTSPFGVFSPSSYGVHPDGQSFVFVHSEGRELAIEVVLNWANELRGRVGPAR